MIRPTLATLRDVLLQVGFVDRSVPEKFCRFEHSLPNTYVLMPPYKEDDIVASYHVAGTRDLLDYRGLMSPAAFEEALRERSLAG